MNTGRICTRCIGGVLAMVLAGTCAAASVGYGRITAARTVTVDNNTARVGGALVGGTIGLASGSNRSGSNQALRGVGGALAGRRIGQAVGQSQAFEYTILIGGSTTTMVTDQSGFRVGDCVAVERGAFDNIRLVDDARCAPPHQAAAPAAAPAPAPASQAAIREADACIQAKEQLLKADTDEDFDRAERRVRLLCGV
jgi:outer membrane lipoprotein SlyB